MDWGPMRERRTNGTQKIGLRATGIGHSVRHIEFGELCCEVRCRELWEMYGERGP
jgi:hypothetical protein